MNMISKVTSDGEAKRVRVAFSRRPMWQRATIVGTPLVALAAAVTLWTSDPSPAAARQAWGTGQRLPYRMGGSQFLIRQDRRSV